MHTKMLKQSKPLAYNNQSTNQTVECAAEDEYGSGQRLAAKTWPKRQLGRVKEEG